MKHVLYFHGFASSPSSSKITALRPLLEPEIEMITPDMNIPSFEMLDWNAIVDKARELVASERPDAIVGSSMGALIALSVANAETPLVLIAPALGIAHRWRDHIPDGDPVLMFNHARGEDAPIHRAFFEQMFEVTVDADPPPSRVTLLMGRNDESVPFDVVEETWGKWVGSGRLVPESKFIAITDGDHGLTAHAELIAREIRAIIA